MTQQDTLQAQMMSEEDFLAHVATLAEGEDSLKHFGKKGMKWGVRKSEASTAAKAERKEVRDKNNKEWDDAIDGARNRIKSGENRANYKQARTEYRSAKKEAAAAFQKVKDKNMEDATIADFAKSGKETRNALIKGGIGVAVLVASAALK